MKIYPSLRRVIAEKRCVRRSTSMGYEIELKRSLGAPGLEKKKKERKKSIISFENRYTYDIQRVT